MSDSVGQLKSTGSQMDFEWEIPGFLSLSAEVDDRHVSSPFSFCDSSWYLRLYPNGEKEDSSEGYVDVYVFRQGSGPPAIVTYSLFFKKTDGKNVIIEEETGTFEKEYSGWGLAKAIKRSDLIDEKSKFLPSGVLTVLCSLKCDETRSAGGTEKLARDFEGLLESGDESDVTVQVRRQTFSLHRAVLAARAPVLNSKFKHGVNKTMGFVNCEAGPFRTFAQYLYTGSAYGISTENVFGLYWISSQYEVDELKAICLHFIKNNLSPDSFCKTLELALRHKEQELEEQATEFLSENASEIMCREDWRNLIKSRTEEMNEFIKNSFIKNSKKFKK